jgi:Ca2+-binding RTX toxin-like protein
VNDTLRFISANISTSLEGRNFTGQTSTHDNNLATTVEDQNVSQTQTWPIDDGLWNESAYMDFAIGNDSLFSNEAWEFLGADSMADL